MVSTSGRGRESGRVRVGAGEVSEQTRDACIYFAESSVDSCHYSLTSCTSYFFATGANPVVINRVLDKMGVRDPVDLSEWDEDQVKALVEAFLLVRFPTILLLNKADQVCFSRF